MALAGIAVGGVVYVLVMPFMSGERKASERVAQRGARAGQIVLRSPRPLQMRKRQVQDTIKNIEAKRKAKKARAAPYPLDPRRP